MIMGGKLVAMQHTLTRESSQHGFTLMEVAMAMVILGIGIMSIVALQVRDTMYNNSSRRQTQGYTRALDKVEELRALSISKTELSTGDHEEDVSVDGHKMYYLKWTVTSNIDVDDKSTAEDEARTVDLKIYSFSDKGKSKAKPISSIVFTKTKSSI
jgi:prepilin-type N-terminal cleavage/methylation domain-containing protein